VWDVQRSCGCEIICQVYLLFHVFGAAHCNTIILYKPTKYTFFQINILISWYLLHVSKPSVHLQEEDCIYRYVFYMHQSCREKNAFDTYYMTIICWASFTETYYWKKTSLLTRQASFHDYFTETTMDSRRCQRQVWMMRTVSDTDRGQLARKISSRPTLTTKNISCGRAGFWNSGSRQEILRFYGTRRFIIVSSRAHPLDLLQRKLFPT